MVIFGNMWVHSLNLSNCGFELLSNCIILKTANEILRTVFPFFTWIFKLGMFFLVFLLFVLVVCCFKKKMVILTAGMQYSQMQFPAIIILD